LDSVTWFNESARAWRLDDEAGIDWVIEAPAARPEKS
jgi:hypothetical protein